MSHPSEPPPADLPAERGIPIWRAAIITPFFSGFFVFLRFYARLYINKKKPTLDDYIVIATLVSVIIYSVLMAQATKHGMGLHVWQFTDELDEEYYLWLGIASEFYVTSLMGFKSALVLLYLQIFGVHRKFRYACYGVLFFTLGYLFCNLITEFLGCSPPQKTWQSDLPGHCIDTVAANIAYGAGHMLSDLMIAILPLTMVWSLKMRSTRQKIGLSLILGAGFLAWAVACIRWAISTYDMLSYDRSYWAGLGFLFSILEVNTGLICACIATLGPLFNSGWKRFRAYTTRGTSKATSGEGSGPDPNKPWNPRAEAGNFSDLTTIGGSGGRSRKASKDIFHMYSGAPYSSRKRSVDPDDTILLTGLSSRTALPPIPPGSADGSERDFQEEQQRQQQLQPHNYDVERGMLSRNLSGESEWPLTEGERHEIHRPETAKTSATRTTADSVNTMAYHEQTGEPVELPGGLRPPSTQAHRTP